MLLAEPPARQARQARLSGFDFVFLLTATLFIIGGCFFMLDLAAAHSSGQESSMLRTITDVSSWLPSMIATLAATVGKYVLLLAASVLNSALIVMLVQFLRSLDRRVSHVSISKREAVVNTSYVRPAKEGRQAAAVRQSSPFLLTPVFR
ncbi:hypothetical protein SAMN02745166_04047 [Prosthecobacter debontii]|uniref:Uncharacterized protein n=2 Tax=Prosthecobacter debontii TaxID=48467 RepID=A0A1T4YR75_9BACT|nr:hypothetical protein SAMN02745166_04047 [Prosthecobacter debontii]